MIKIHIKNTNILMTEIYKCGRFKYGCRVQIWKKIFCQNSQKFGYSFIQNDIRPATLSKRDSSCFPTYIAKFLRTAFL